MADKLEEKAEVLAVNRLRVHRLRVCKDGCTLSPVLSIIAGLFWVYVRPFDSALAKLALCSG